MLNVAIYSCVRILQYDSLLCRCWLQHQLASSDFGGISNFVSFSRLFFFKPKLTDWTKHYASLEGHSVGVTQYFLKHSTENYPMKWSFLCWYNTFSKLPKLDLCTDLCVITTLIHTKSGVQCKLKKFIKKML